MKVKGGQPMRDRVKAAVAKLAKFYDEGDHPGLITWLEAENRLVNDLFDALLEAGTGRELTGIGRGEEKTKRLKFGPKPPY